MGGRVPPVPVVEPPVPPPVPPTPPAPPLVEPPLPFPVGLPPEVVEVSELHPWNVDQATTAKTTGIANRANLMASPSFLRKLPLPTPSKWRSDERNAQRHISPAA
jgi:hypothetical protein